MSHLWTSWKYPLINANSAARKWKQNSNCFHICAQMFFAGTLKVQCRHLVQLQKPLCECLIDWQQWWRFWGLNGDQPLFLGGKIKTHSSLTALAKLGGIFKYLCLCSCMNKNICFHYWVSVRRESRWVCRDVLFCRPRECVWLSWAQRCNYISPPRLQKWRRERAHPARPTTAGWCQIFHGYLIVLRPPHVKTLVELTP